jgi:hypothetical protein
LESRKKMETLEKKVNLAYEIAKKERFRLLKLDHPFGIYTLHYLDAEHGFIYIGLCHFVLMRDNGDLVEGIVSYKRAEKDEKAMKILISKRFLSFEFGFIEPGKTVRSKYKCIDENVGCPWFAIPTSEEFKSFLQELVPVAIKRALKGEVSIDETY